MAIEIGDKVRHSNPRMGAGVVTGTAKKTVTPEPFDRVRVVTELGQLRMQAEALQRKLDIGTTPYEVDEYIVTFETGRVETFGADSVEKLKARATE